MSNELSKHRIIDWNERATAEWRLIKVQQVDRDGKAGELLTGVVQGLQSINTEAWKGRGTIVNTTPVRDKNYLNIGVSLKAESPRVFPETIEVNRRGSDYDLKLVGVSDKTVPVELFAGVNMPQSNGDNTYVTDPFIFRIISTAGEIEHAALRDFEIRSVLPKDKKEEGVIYTSGEPLEKRLEILFKDPIRHAAEIERFFDGSLLGYIMAGESPDFQSIESAVASYRSGLIKNIGKIVSFNDIYGQDGWYPLY